MTQRICDCVLSQNGLGMSGRECNCPAFTLPPTGDVGELVERVALMADAEASSETVKLIVDLRDALTAQAARIAELEVDRNEALNAAVESSEIAGEACIKAHDATARAERLEALIRPIAPLAVMGDEKSDPRWKDAPKSDEDIIQASISLGQLRAMRAALSEGGDGWEVKEQK